MSAIRVACQTYTWEMLGAEWQGQVTDMLDWIAGAGYEGIEITNTMIGDFYDQPERFAGELARRNLKLAAFAYATTGFTDPNHWAEDVAGARQAIEFLHHFPEPRLGLGGAAHPSPENARQKLDQAIGFYNEVGRMGVDQGISVNVHPHSHHCSLLESAEAYAYLMDNLDARYVSFGPDTGHIVRGGQDLMTCLQTYISRITHLHLKDATATGAWVALGEGVCDFPAVVAFLESVDYGGWIVAEEESAEARQDGLAAIRKNRAYLQTIGY
jgi:sugar phosphate isomerase/epimerase